MENCLRCTVGCCNFAFGYGIMKKRFTKIAKRCNGNAVIVEMHSSVAIVTKTSFTLCGVCLQGAKSNTQIAFDRCEKENEMAWRHSMSGRMQMKCTTKVRDTPNTSSSVVVIIHRRRCSSRISDSLTMKHIFVSLPSSFLASFICT